MGLLVQFIPPIAHPYDLLASTSLSSSQTIITLAFCDSQLISGAKDCHVRNIIAVVLHFLTTAQSSAI